MTSPSLRKLPTTRLSTPTCAEIRRPWVSLWSASLLSAAIAGLSLSPLGADVRGPGAGTATGNTATRGGHAPWRASMVAEPEAPPSVTRTVPRNPLGKTTTQTVELYQSAASKLRGASAARRSARRPARAMQTANQSAALAEGQKDRGAEGQKDRGTEGQPARAIQTVNHRAAVLPADESPTAGFSEIAEPSAAATLSPSALPDWPLVPGNREGGERLRGPLSGADDHEPEACERLEELPRNLLAQGPAGLPAPAPTAADGLTERQRRVREQLVRPFRRIHEIKPHYDYEPDEEHAQQDKCFNLCPRPGGPDCPDCEVPGPDGVAEGLAACPECPDEIDLRDTSRFAGESVDFPVRSFPHIHYCWEPTNLWALPLYFEDFCLERYGHTRCYAVQPPFSVALFAAQMVGLPYQMVIDPPWAKRYALGWYRPGQYVPYKYYQAPWNTKAALVEAGVITGGWFLFAPGVGP